MAFDEVRLPEDVEKGAQGGPRFRTTIVELNSGHEQRNQNWAQTRGEWDLSYGIQEKVDFMAVVRFFYARRGNLNGFRFKDWSDYEATGSYFGTGDGTTTLFPLGLRYDDGSFTFDRIVTKPVTGTVTIYIDLVAQTEITHYTIDYDTGEVTFVSPPADMTTLTWDGEFDVPVRFDLDNDALDINIETFMAGTLPRIQIKELRL